MKIGHRLKQIVGTVAPKLGTALGGPLGGIAGKLVRDALGVESDSAVLDALETNPDALLKLKQAEQDFEARMRELDISEEQLHQQDRSSARQMATATSIAPQVAMSALFIIGYFIIVGLFFSDTLVIPMGEAFYLLVGVLTAAIPQILAFWFGSSSGSKQKTDALTIQR